MSDEPRTRHIGADELTRALAALDEPDAVAARPIRVTRDALPRGKRPGDPATALGLGAPRKFERDTRASSRTRELPQPRLSVPPSGRVSEARASVPPRALTVPHAPMSERGLQAWHAWLAAIVLAGFALSGLFALSMHATRATARVPPATLRVPAALPAGTPVTSALEPPAAVPAVRFEAGPAIAERRSAVDALLAGRTRVALERYRALLALPTLADRPAIERVVQVLARELRSCEQEAGTPCGF